MDTNFREMNVHNPCSFLSDTHYFDNGNFLGELFLLGGLNFFSSFAAIREIRG
jgi:hypothetical protein